MNFDRAYKLAWLAVGVAFVAVLFLWARGTPGDALDLIRAK